MDKVYICTFYDGEEYITPPVKNVEAARIYAVGMYMTDFYIPVYDPVIRIHPDYLGKFAKFLELLRRYREYL